MLFIFNVNLSVYLSAVEELCYFAFCCTCERILQEPRLGIYEGNTFFKNKGHELTRNPPCLCCSIGLSNVIYFVRCKDKSPLVLFDTSAIFVWGEGCWKKISVSTLFQSIHVVCRSSSAAAAAAHHTMLLLWAMFPIFLLLRGGVSFSQRM